MKAEQTTGTTDLLEQDLERVKRLFILQVKEEMMTGIWDHDKVKKAYQYIIGSDDPANVLVVRRAILTYE